MGIGREAVWVRGSGGMGRVGRVGRIGRVGSMGRVGPVWAGQAQGRQAGCKAGTAQAGR